jgi:hypothetical protein
MRTQKLKEKAQDRELKSHKSKSQWQGNQRNHSKMTIRTCAMRCIPDKKN